VVAALFEPVGAAAGFGIATLLGMDDASRVRKRSFSPLFLYDADHFTKTGSGHM
jgi:hypothetical protein